MNAVVKYVDSALLSLSSIREIGSNERWYRYVSYAGKRCLFIQTPAFMTTAPTSSRYRQGILQLTVPMEALGEIIKVDKYVQENCQLPANAPAVWRQTVAGGGEFYRRIDPATNEVYYMTIEPEAPVFNMQRERQTNVELGEGEYRCMVHVRGVYIGAHGSLPKFASLQLRIVQVMYTPRSIRGGNICLFLPISDGEEEEDAEAVIRPQQLLTDSMMDELFASLTDNSEQQPQTASASSSTGVASKSLPAPLPPVQPIIQSVSSLATPTITVAATESLPAPLPSVQPIIQSVSSLATPTTVTSTSQSSSKRPSIRKRRAAAVPLPQLTIPPPPITATAPPKKRASMDIEQRREELLGKYMALDYPTQDANEEDAAFRYNEQMRLSDELVNLLGPEWKRDYYYDFQEKKASALFRSD